jgi:hypothetical protein
MSWISIVNVSRLLYNSGHVKERNKMEQVTLDSYNPHALVTLKKIINEGGDAQFTLYKATELEEILDNPTLDVVETKSNGEHVVHQMKRTDVMELFRQRGYNLARLEAQEKQIGLVLNKMTADEWYSSNTSKEDVLSDLCDILGFEPKQTIRISATVEVEVDYDCPLNEIEDFDAGDFLQDVLTIDTYHGDAIVYSYNVDSADWATH